MKRAIFAPPCSGSCAPPALPPPSPVATASSASRLTSAVEVALADRLEEAAASSSRCSPRARSGPAASTWRRARRASWRQFSRRLADDLRDLVVAVVEDVVQQEDRALDRLEALERDQQRHRDRLVVGGARSDDQRLGSHGPRRSPGARGRSAARRSPAGRPPSPRTPSDAPRRARGAGAAALLHDVLGLGDAAEHPVGDRERQRAAASRRSPLSRTARPSRLRGAANESKETNDADLRRRSPSGAVGQPLVRSSPRRATRCSG